MSEVDGIRSEDTPCEGSVGASTPPKMVAPILRVEELRDSEVRSTCSDTDGLSHGEASDQEVGDGPGQKQLGEFVEPDPELVEKIINQVEFYFSDANILKDAFLLKHVRRNKMGYVSLKLITSFKRVKSLTKDYRVTAFSLRQSNELEVNEEGTKVRRRTPLPDYDETTPSRTVVAVNLPLESPTIEGVAELFKECGEIALIRILRPGKNIPQDVKKHINKHPELGSSVCAVIEFETHESAKKACDTFTNKDDWRSGMRVVLLASKKQKKEPNSSKDDSLDPKSANEQHDGPSDEGDDRDRQEQKKRKKTKNKRKNSRVEEIRDNESTGTSSGSELDSDTSPRRASRGRITLSPHQENLLGVTPGSSPRSSPNVSPRVSPRNSPTSRRRNIHGRSPLAVENSPNPSPRHSPHVSPEMRRKRVDSDGSCNSSPNSPWVQRRLKAQETSPLAAGRSPGASPMLGRRNEGSPRMADMEGVIRQPRGPDGTRGFSAGRGQMIEKELNDSVW